MLDKLIIFSSILISGYVCCIPTQLVDKEELVSTTGIMIFETSTIAETTTSTTTTTTIPLILGCLNGWTKFDRGTYYWCMKVYWGYTTGPIADALCSSLNSTAVCSGFQNEQELATMMTIAYSEVQALRRLFLGLKRTSACWTSYITSTCNALNSFNWTDGHTTGTEGLQWAPDRPDNYELAQPYVWIDDTTNQMDDEFATAGRDGAICGMEADYYPA